MPWVQRVDDARVAIAGPDALCFRTPVEVHGENLTTVAEFTVEAGRARARSSSRGSRRTRAFPTRSTPRRRSPTPESYWREWADAARTTAPYHEEIHASLLVLKALTYAPTGGIVAAPTTSLPEWIGGVRNWDYRFCWLRDATLTLLAMLQAGYRDEAIAWREWLLRAVAGDPADVQIMYGLAGERRLDERELDWLPGLRGVVPGAHRQRRVDAAAARRLRRGDRRAVPDAPRRGSARRQRLVAASARCSRWLEDGWRPRTPGSGRCAGRHGTSRTRR